MKLTHIRMPTLRPAVASVDPHSSRVQSLMTILLLVYASVLAFVITREKWLYVAAAGMLPALLLWPVPLALGSFALMVPFDSVAAVTEGTAGPGTTLNWYIGAGAGLVLLFTSLAHGRLERPPKAALWWGMLMLWGVITTTWALDPEAALKRLPTALALFLLYLVAVSARIDDKEFWWIAGLSILGGTFASLAAAFQLVQGLGYQGRATLVLAGRVTDPNLVAAALILPLSLAAGAFLAARRLTTKAASVLGLSVIALGILLTMSRGSLVAVAVVLLVYLYRYRVNWRVLVAAAIIPLIAIGLPSLFFTRVQESLLTHAQGRFDIWWAGLHLLRDRGLQGAGLDNFRVLYAKYAGSAPVFRGYSRESHNIYLGTAVDLGVVGFGLLMAAIAAQLRPAKEFGRKGNTAAFAAGVSCEAACWGILVMGMSIDILWVKAFWLSWILLAVAVRNWRAQKGAVAP